MIRGVISSLPIGKSITIENIRRLIPQKYQWMSDRKITSLLSCESDMHNPEIWVWERTDPNPDLQ